MHSKNNSGLLHALACWSLFLFAACGDEGGEVQAVPELVVYTTFYPTTYFTERIAGDVLEVVCPVPADADPIFWQPTREDLAAYQAATLIVVNGASFEKWIEQASLPTSRLVDTARGFQSDFLQYESRATHSHGAGGEHTHEGVDGHTWLDPELARAQAEAIEKALAQRLPDHAEAFAAGLKALAADLDALGGELAALDVSGARLLASHPAYNYLGRRYDWTIDNFDFDPGEALSDEQLGAVREAATGDGKPILLWEGQPLPAAVAALDAIGVRSVVFSPCEALGPDEQAAGDDYLSLMRGNVQELKGALEGH
ncbi:MAG: zinc ABC transporter substrate-binding protein [bacterium]|nr:zinc ABC transporter substrate-binding protein [bacterium]